VLVIERVSWRRHCYVVHDDGGHAGSWMRRRFAEAMTGDVDGNPYELRRDGRKRFALVSSGTVLATAGAPKRNQWTITADGSVYQLRRCSRWRSDMELGRAGIRVGSIRRGRAARGQVLCDLPAELSPSAQAFIGFVVLTLWNRAAASSGSAVAVATG
jgi:hypothetical protein